jgi:hypothetical protein
MAEPIGLQTMLTYLTLISVPVGVFYHIMTLRNQSKTRQAQLFMQVYSQYTASKYREWNEIIQWEWDDYDDFERKYGDLDSRNKWSSIGGYLEGLGVFVKEGLIPVRLVSLFITNLTRTYWEKFGPLIEEYRVRMNVPRGGSESEYLYKAIMKYVEEHPELAT